MQTLWNYQGLDAACGVWYCSTFVSRTLRYYTRVLQSFVSSANLNRIVSYIWISSRFFRLKSTVRMNYYQWLIANRKESRFSTLSYLIIYMKCFLTKLTTALDTSSKLNSYRVVFWVLEPEIASRLAYKLTISVILWNKFVTIAFL